MNETNITAANYIIDYYKAVMALNEYTSIYINLILELKAKYGEELAKLEPETQNALQTQTQNFRHFANKVMLMYEGIFSLKELKKNNKVTESYNYIVANYGLDPVKARAFTVEINKCLVNDVFQEILTDSKQIIEKIFDNAKK